MKTWFLTILTSAMLVISNAAMCGAGPVEQRGKNWDTAAFRINNSGNKAVIITATNTTTNAGSGNTTRILLKLNNETIADSILGQATQTLIGLVAEPGSYVVEAYCSNTIADAETCKVSVDSAPLASF